MLAVIAATPTHPLSRECPREGGRPRPATPAHNPFPARPLPPPRSGTRSITGLTDHCTSFVLLAAYGVGAHELEKAPVTRGPQWSAAQLLQQPMHLYLTAKTPAEAAALPTDFQSLYRYGLRSFLSIPIATDHEVLGVLTIAKEDADGFEVEWWVIRTVWVQGLGFSAG